MIELKNVTKEYRKRHFFKKDVFVRGVSSLNIKIGPGAFGLLGINGAGKTTTLKMIATLLRPSSGKILIDGQDSIVHEKKLRKRINMITGSDRMLYFRLTGKENLQYFASLYGLESGEVKERCGKLLELTGLTEAADKRVEEYSRGMKQRLAIARGLVNDPDILLLDEPTLGLDVSIAAEIRAFIKNVLLADGEKTVILTSHYMSEIEDICSSIGILQEGVLIYRGDFSNLYREMGMEEVHRFFLPGDQFIRKPEIEKIISGDVAWRSSDEGLEFVLGPEDGYRFLSKMDRLSLKGISYSQEKPDLEEAVLRLSRSVKTAV